MTREEVGCSWRGRRRGRRTLFEPLQHVAGADQDDDRLQDGDNAGEHPLQDEVEGLGSDLPEKADVANVNGFRGTELLSMLRRGEQPLQSTRPVCVLIEQVAFRLAPAGHEDAVERLVRADAQGPPNRALRPR